MGGDRHDGPTICSTGIKNNKEEVKENEKNINIYHTMCWLFVSA